MKLRPTLNVTALPPIGYGITAPLWWGTVLLLSIEGTVFLLTIAAYYYIALNYGELPPARTPPPDLIIGTISVVVTIASAYPMFRVQRAAELDQKSGMRVWLTISILFALVMLLIRGYEFPRLFCRWDTHAYGSCVWLLLGMHTFHLITTIGESILLLVWCMINDIDEKHRLDLEVNAVYWYFVVISYVVIYGVIYWSPRLIH